MENTFRYQFLEKEEAKKICTSECDAINKSLLDWCVDSIGRGKIDKAERINRVVVKRISNFGVKF